MGKPLKVTTFRNRFAALVEESEKTTIDLAKELHVSNQTISAWKTGARSPKEPTIIALAKHFGVTVEWLMGFDADKWDAQSSLTNAFRGAGHNVPDQPMTPEARILAKGIDRMPQAQREAIVNMMMGLYPNVFKKGTEDDDT